MGYQRKGLRSHVIGIACNTNYVIKKLLKNSKSKK